MQINSTTFSAFVQPAYADKARFRAPVTIEAEVIKTDKQTDKSQSDYQPSPFVRTFSFNVNSAEKTDTIKTEKQLPTGITYYLQVESLSPQPAKQVIDETV